MGIDGTKSKLDHAVDKLWNLGNKLVDAGVKEELLIEFEKIEELIRDYQKEDN